MIIREIVLSSILFLSTYNFAQQNVSISDISTTPHASSVLDISSSTKGLLIPRVALTSINVSTPIGSAPLTSLLVYNTATAGTAPNNVTPGYYYWDGTKWCRFDTGNNVGDWKLLGNAGTNVSDNFLGTTDNVDLVFRTNNAEKVRVLSGGNVGIGEINPQRLLHMKGTAGNVALRLENSTAGARTFDIQSTNGGHLHIINQSSTPAYVPFRVDGLNNNIGIFNGAPDASAALDITGQDPITTSLTRGLLIPRLALTATNASSPVTSPATSLLVYNTATADTAPNNVIPGYYYNSNTPAAPIWRRFATGNGDAWITTGNTALTSPADPVTYGVSTITSPGNWIGTTDAVDYVIGTNSIERMRVKHGTGRVGIGLANPFMRLDVTDASTTTDDATIRGVATGAARTYGVMGETTSITTNASGVRGVANGAGSVNGVFGTSTSTLGTGVCGLASSTTGNNVGVFGLSSSDAGDGVVGVNNSLTGSTAGVTGLCESPHGWGVFAVNNAVAGNGTGVGVYGATS